SNRPSSRGSSRRSVRKRACTSRPRASARSASTASSSRSPAATASASPPKTACSYSSLARSIRPSAVISPPPSDGRSNSLNDQGREGVRPVRLGGQAQLGPPYRALPRACAAVAHGLADARAGGQGEGAGGQEAFVRESAVGDRGGHPGDAQRRRVGEQRVDHADDLAARGGDHLPGGRPVAASK